MSNRNKIRNALLSFAPIRELLFFIFQKKVYKGQIDRKISALLKGKRKLSEKKIDNLIVSLTSFPQRIAEVKYVIYSLLDQTIRPEKIVLWLERSKFPNKEQDLPEDLLSFEQYGLVIDWCDNLRSYCKLVPALEMFPDYYIATVDDDIYYKRDWLEKLWAEHLKFPDNPVCHLTYSKRFINIVFLPYLQSQNIKCIDTKHQILGAGVAGILWHKRYLHADINRSDLFRKLAPHADDLWFYFMAILNGAAFRLVKKPYSKMKYVNPCRDYGLTTGDTLTSINVVDDYCLNKQQFENIFNHYKNDLLKKGVFALK